MDLNKIRSLEGEMAEQPTAETYERKIPNGSLIRLMIDYTNKKEHFFRVSQSYAPNHNDVARALDLYMNASDKYHNAKNKQ